MQEFLTVAEVAEKYDVDEETVRRWVRCGTIHGARDLFKPGCPYFFTVAEIERFEKERRMSHVSEVADD